MSLTERKLKIINIDFKMELTRMPEDIQIGYLECITPDMKGVVVVYSGPDPIGIILYDSDECSWYFINGIDSVNNATLGDSCFMGLIDQIEREYDYTSFKLTQFK